MYVVFVIFLQIRKRRISMLVMLVCVHDREGVPETPAGAREGHRAGDESELCRLRRRPIIRSRSQQTYAQASRRPILLLRYLHLSHSSTKKGNKNCRRHVTTGYKCKKDKNILFVFFFSKFLIVFSCELKLAFILYGFALSFQLIQHRRMHTGEKPHLCPHCAYRSARRDNLRSHVRRVHKKENLYCDTFSPRGMLINPSLLASSRDDDNDLVQSPSSSPSSNPDTTN